MSIFSKIASAEHTFAAWAEKELTKLVGAEPKIEAIADTILKYVGPALQTIVTASAGSAAGTIVGKVVTEAQSDITALSGLIYDFGATPSAASVAASIQSNLGTLLTAGHVTDTASVATVTKVTSELGALATALTTKP